MYTSAYGNSPSVERLRDVTSLTVRRAETRDLPRLNEFLNHYIVHTAINFVLEPLTLDQRAEWFAAYGPTGRHQMLVAEAAGVVLGLASTGQFSPKHAYDTTVEVSIVCAPEAVGFGIGIRLYEHLFPAIADEDIHVAVAAITMPNDASCALHERFGFERAAVLPEVGRKFGQYWDVAWYVRRMPA